ncbi:MAG: hypothetical protein ACYSU0_05925 [Planctomycetota bacterium]|jgi:HEAT repeat protein
MTAERRLLAAALVLLCSAGCPPGMSEFEDKLDYVTVLSLKGTRHSFRKLVALLDSEDAEMIKLAVGGIHNHRLQSEGGTWPRYVVPRLIELYENPPEEKRADIRNAVLGTLGALGGDKAIEFLGKRWSQDQYHLEALLATLRNAFRRGEELTALPYVLQAAKLGDVSQKKTVLVRIGYFAADGKGRPLFRNRPEILRCLKAGLADQDLRVQEIAIKGVATQFPRKEAIAVLREFVGSAQDRPLTVFRHGRAYIDKTPFVDGTAFTIKDRARVELLKLGDDKQLAAIRELLIGSRRFPHGPLREEVMDALVGVPTQESVDLLKEMLSRELDHQWVIGNTIGKVKDAARRQGRTLDL